MSDELKKIKKIYGEEMMHLCRSLFPTLLENEGKLLEILEKVIAPTHSLASDIIKNNYYDEFKNLIYSYIDVEEDEVIEVNESPFELMDKAGYTLYECKTEADIQSFKKYYYLNEELCSFRGGRLERCHVFFAVKKNVDEIKRENYNHPRREDEYGTSVISIQFARGMKNTLSIKNRYNHTVNNPDATFSNNLENIIPGLTRSFENYYGLNIIQQDDLRTSFLTSELKYARSIDGKYYRYNDERNGIYYCENNIILFINGIIDLKYAQNKERYLLIDHYIIDRKEKTINLYGEDNEDAFVESINRVGVIKDIEVIKKDDDRIINIKYQDGKNVKIEINKQNAITGYENDYIKEINRDFLFNNTTLKNISIPSVKRISDNFLFSNNCLKNISLPCTEEIADDFLYFNHVLENIYAPRLKRVGNNFLVTNTELKRIELPSIEEIFSGFISLNKDIIEVIIPKVQRIGMDFLSHTNKIKSIDLPNALEIGNSFLASCIELERIYLPKAQVIRDDFLFFNNKLKNINLPSANIIGNNFLMCNDVIERINIPEVREIGDAFLIYSQLKRMELPKVYKVGERFLDNDKQLEIVIAPMLKKIDDIDLARKVKKKLNVPLIKKVGFLLVKRLRNVNVPLLRRIGNYALGRNDSTPSFINIDVAIDELRETEENNEEINNNRAK